MNRFAAKNAKPNSMNYLTSGVHKENYSLLVALEQSERGDVWKG